MSAQDELPPGWKVTEEQWMGITGPRDVWVVWNAFDSRCPGADGIEGFFSRDVAVGSAWLSFGITREELATMRAAAERCAELEAELKDLMAAYDDERKNKDAALSCAHTELLRADKAEAALATSYSLEWQTKRADKAETALAKVTAERDEARGELDRALMDMAAGFADITPGAD
jgi:hypothetical protein